MLVEPVVGADKYQQRPPIRQPYRGRTAPNRCRPGRPTDLRLLLGRPQSTAPVCNVWPDFCPSVVFEIALFHFAQECRLLI